MNPSNLLLAEPMSVMVDYTDLIDWTAMEVPPCLHSRIYSAQKAAPMTVVVTLTEDFASVAAQWATASPDSRSRHFWDLGLLHIAEVEVARLPTELRDLAVARLRSRPRSDNPRAAASKVARIIREVCAEHPETEPSDRCGRLKADLDVYRKLLAIRASGPYCGPGPDEGIHFLRLADPTCSGTPIERIENTLGEDG
jgi:hypothetical protein